MPSSAAAASAPSTDTATTMNGSSPWHREVYIKPEAEIIWKSTDRQDAAVAGSSGSSQPIDMTTPTISLGVSGVSDKRNAASCDVKTNDLLSPSKTSTSPEVCRRAEVAGGGYKYKDNIKRRFCSEGDDQAPNYVDTRSYSSLSDGASSAPDYSPPSSPGGPVQQNSTTLRDRDEDCSCRRNVAEDHTPGFVLHPSGSYYLPVIAATEQVRGLVSASSRESPAVVCHPVSIPVCFTSGRTATADVVCVDVTAAERRHQCTAPCQSLLQLQRL